MSNPEKTKSQIKSQGVTMLVMGCITALVTIYFFYRLGFGTAVIAMLLPTILFIRLGIKGIREAKQMPE
jgi:hypothetical protein